jgi:predicted ArsR family transcriptional regulator
MIAGRSTRMEVLEHLRRKQTASAESIGAELGITANAVRQHLTNLEREGLVNSQPVRNGRGRPVLRFSLTERADAVFPKRYGQLATMVLTEIQEMDGPQALDEIFRRVAIRHVDHIRPELEGLSFDEKLKRLVAWIGRAGTLAESENTSDGVRVTIHNCPFRNTALKFPQVCTITPQMLATALDAPVAQSDSIHRRDPYCSFVVQRPDPAPYAQ